MNKLIQHQITLAEAIELTTRFRNNPGKDMFLSEMFDADSVMKVITQAGCKSLRIYFGRKEDNSIHSILVGVDAHGNDILPPTSNLTKAEDGDDDGTILENAYHCPPVCSADSPLNG